MIAQKTWSRVLFALLPLSFVAPVWADGGQVGNKAAAPGPSRQGSPLSKPLPPPGMPVPPAVAPAPPPPQQQGQPEVTTTPQGTRISVGGHINRAVNTANDGSATKAYFVDNGNIPTFAYIKGYKDVSSDLTIGGHIEIALRANSATAASQDNPTPGFSTGARYFELTVDSKRWGKVSFGNGLSSAFFLADLDLVGMLPYNMLSTGGAFGGLKFVDAGTGALSDQSIAGAFFDLEAINLIGRLRYDLPAWKGFRLSGNVGENSYAAVALRWNGQLGDFDLNGVTSVQSNPQGGRIDKRIDGGFGVLHRPTGLSFIAGGVSQDFVRELAGSDPSSSGFSIRGGWRRQALSWGETKLALDYQRSENITAVGDRPTTMGLFFGQSIQGWNTELYAGYRFYSLDRPDIDLSDIHGFTVGVRIVLDATFTAGR